MTAGTDTAVSSNTGTVIVWNTGTLQSVTNRGSTTTNAISITNTASSTSTTTGALTVTGGVGIGGALYVGTSSYINGALIITTATINQYASQTTITAGTDTVVNTSTGAVTIWDTSTLQSVTGRGATTTNAISITNTTSSTSTTTGALKVTGGVGVAGTIYAQNATIANNGTFTMYRNASQYFTIENSDVTTNPTFKSYAGTNNAKQIQYDSRTDAAGTTATAGLLGHLFQIQGNYALQINWSTVTNALSGTQVFGNVQSTGSNVGTLVIGQNTSGGLGVGGNIYQGGIHVIQNSTAASSTSSGALQVWGGVGIGGKLFVGGLANNTSSYIAYYNTTTGELSFSTNPVQQTLVVANTSTASFFLTFVDSNNSTAQGEVFYTTSSFTINPATGNVTVGTTAASLSTSTSTGALQVRGGVGVSDSVYVGNRVGFVGTTQASVVYQFYNTLTNSLDTVFG